MGPLLRELIFEAVRRGKLRNGLPLDCALRDLLVAELHKTSAVPAEVALPADRRALRAAETVMETLSEPAPLSSICRSAGLSVRTLRRIFRREVGTDFETWRRPVRLAKAIELLVSGSSVKEAAFAVGYQQPNPLVELFRTTFGTTPGF